VRISRQFNLGRTQPQLDFVDVDLDGDTKLFVDPKALQLIESEWGDECVALIQDFFRHVISLISGDQDEEAWRLLRVLKEPNETHLGLSKGRSRGRGLGDDSAADVWEALSNSEAVRSGLLEDLEDTILMIPGISNDIISDIATNIIRRPLIEFTEEACDFYEIPLTPDVDSGPMWNPQTHAWYSEFVSLPVVHLKKVLFVPKAIVRKRMEFNPDEYLTHFVLEAMQQDELSANTELVQLLKNGDPYVTKTSLREKYGEGKALIIEQTRKHPELLDKYRAAKRAKPTPPLEHTAIAAVEGSEQPDWDALLDAVTAIAPGQATASAYHRAVEALLQALFYPALGTPKRESRLHDGRKRIDIRFTNMARDGFFWRVATHHQIPAGYVVVECKNYTEEVGNPEVDQVAGRFAPDRGRLGLLVCRTIEDHGRCIARCRDSANDDQGWIIPLSDDDLRVLVEERKATPWSLTYQRLEDLFSEITS
jgi:hypothetical protein